MNSTRHCHLVPGLPEVVVDGFFLDPRPSADQDDGAEGDDGDNGGTGAGDDDAGQEVFYFLSHFHGDHYRGLDADWHRTRRGRRATIFCSAVTRALLCSPELMGIPEMRERGSSSCSSGEEQEEGQEEKEEQEQQQEEEDNCTGKGEGEGKGKPLVVALEKDRRVEFPRFFVTLLDAHHCPGACMLLFERKSDGRAVLHTGDFRFDPAMLEYPALQTTRVHTVMLDTTYAEPKHRFPPRAEIVARAGELACAFVRRQATPSSVRIFVGSYNIGKERVLLAVKDALQAAGLSDAPVLTDARRLAMIRCTMPERLHDFVIPEDSDDTLAGPGGRPSLVHVTRMGEIADMWPFFRPNYTAIADRVERINSGTRSTPVQHVLALVPTGWAESSAYNKRNACVQKQVHPTLHVTVQLLPYSEHSNNEELCRFVKFLRPVTICPTVFRDEQDSQTIVRRFHTLCNQTASKQSFLNRMVTKKATRAAGKRPAKRVTSANGSNAASEPVDLDKEESDGGDVLGHERDEDEDVHCVSTTATPAPCKRKRHVAPPDMTRCPRCTFEQPDQAACAMCGNLLPAKRSATGQAAITAFFSPSPSASADASSSR